MARHARKHQVQYECCAALVENAQSNSSHHLLACRLWVSCMDACRENVHFRQPIIIRFEDWRHLKREKCTWQATCSRRSSHKFMEVSCKRMWDDWFGWQRAAGVCERRMSVAAETRLASYRPSQETVRSLDHMQDANETSVLCSDRNDYRPFKWGKTWLLSPHLKRKWPLFFVLFCFAWGWR